VIAGAVGYVECDSEWQLKWHPVTRMSAGPQKGVQQTGPNPLDWGKPGSKRHVLTL
jgi:hypothetical protein